MDVWHCTPVAYFSVKLDPVAAAHLAMCLRAVAAVVKSVNASRDIVVFSEHLSHVTFKLWTLNAECLSETLYFFPQKKTVTNIIVLHLLIKFIFPRSYLQEPPLQNQDLKLFVDGSAFKIQKTDHSCIGYAIVTKHEIVKAMALPRHLSAQAAELISSTEAYKLAQGKTVAIFTDSKYAF